VYAKIDPFVEKTLFIFVLFIAMIFWPEKQIDGLFVRNKGHLSKEKDVCLSTICLLFRAYVFIVNAVLLLPDVLERYTPRHFHYVFISPNTTRNLN